MIVVSLLAGLLSLLACTVFVMLSERWRARLLLW